MLSRFPYPTEKGDKLRAYHQLKELAESWEIHLICVSDEPISIERREAIEPFCTSIHVFELNKLMLILLVGWQFFTHKPFQYGYFYQPAIARKIKQLVEHIQPDHIFCQLIRPAAYVKNYHNCPKTIDYMDALSMGIKRRIAHAKWWNRWLFQSEWRRLVRYESVLFDYFEGHTMISEQDREFIQHPRRKEIQVIANGVDAAFFEQVDASEFPEVDVVFTGNMSYPPNVSAVNFIANDIFPELQRRGRNVRFLISGANPDSAVLQHKDKLEVSGWVDDIRTSYARARIFIAPMHIGTGLQNKLLEAMACGLPCITTPLCNNALKASSDEILLAETASEYAEKICELLDNPEKAVQLGEHGRKFVRNTYDWKKATQKLSAYMMSFKP